ncbi:glycosyltransferase [Thermoleophilum album]|uniref:glycosyltransferase n=1 Tax=Thermoleophilum album TaxID=29539 RepID=UPI00115FCBB2|nr:glycosyltransferase [Thermoleophilum album]
MRILVFHAYLLRGTGSNIYNAELARALAAAGHEVHLICQEHRARELGFVNRVIEAVRDERDVAAATDSGAGSGGGSVSVWIPEIGETLPVYVADHYERFRAVPLPQLDDNAIKRYVHTNVVAVRAIAQRVRPDAALANHLVMGPVIVRRALRGLGVPYVVKIHGSALEYVVRPHPERFLSYAREGLEEATCVLVGSSNLGRRLLEVVALPGLERKLRLAPPGVRTDLFRPLGRNAARARLRSAWAAPSPRGDGGWGEDPRAGEAIRRFAASDGPLAAYVGKLIPQKGVHTAILAWPLVASRVPDARLAIVGFGSGRESLERLREAIAGCDFEAAERALLEFAAAGSASDVGALPDEIRARTPPATLVDAALASLRRVLARQADEYVRGAPAAAAIEFTGALPHERLAWLLPALDAVLVPSLLEEAFGMIAVEAAACGCPPIVADHSGLAEIAVELESALPERVPPLRIAGRTPQIEALAGRTVQWLTLDERAREEARRRLAAAAQRWSWERVAADVAAALAGRVEALPSPRL